MVMKNNHYLVPLFFSLYTLNCQADTLSVLNWEEYLSESVIQMWQEETGHTVEQVLFDNDEKRDSILMKPDHHRIDIAIVDETVAERFGESGLLVGLSEDRLPSISNAGEFWRNRCGNYAVPYFWGTLGIVYRSDKFEQPPSSWKDLLEPEDNMKGHVGMLDDYTDMLAPALFMMGKNLNSEDKEDLAQAFNILKRQTNDVLTYEYAITYLHAGNRREDLYMALAYGGDQYTMNNISESEELWKYVIPEEGTVLWVDCLAIPKTSKNIELALDFIEFLNRPEIAAINAEDVYVATPNEAALQITSDAYNGDPEVFPSQDILNKSALYKPLSNENVETRLRITNAILNIHESQ